MICAIKIQRGFTLIELVAVIVILAILAAIAIPKFSDMQVEAKDAQARAVAGAISSWSAMNFAAFVANGETSTNFDGFSWPIAASRQCGNSTLLGKALSSTSTQIIGMSFSGTIPINCPAGSMATCSVAHNDTLNYQPYQFVCATY